MPQARAATLTRPTSTPSIICAKPLPDCAAQHLGLRDAEAVEHHLGGVDALVAHLVDLAGDREPLGDLAEPARLLDQQRRQVLVGLLGALVGLDEHRGEVRRAAVGQPHLGAVDHVVVAVGLRAGLDGRDVGAQVRLRHGEGAGHLPGRELRQVLLLLLLGAVVDDHVADDEVGVDDARDAHPPARDLLDDQRVGRQRLAQTAVLLRDHEPEQAHLLHPVDDRLRVLVGVLELLGVRDDLLVHVVADGGEDLLLDLRESRGLGEACHASCSLLWGWLPASLRYRACVCVSVLLARKRTHEAKPKLSSPAASSARRGSSPPRAPCPR